jgi:hypothetical protein
MEKRKCPRFPVMLPTVFFGERAGELTLCFQFSKYFPIYISVSVQDYSVHFGKGFGIPKGPESCRFRFAGGRGSVVGNIAHARSRLLLRSGKDDKQPLFLLSGQAALIID